MLKRINAINCVARALSANESRERKRGQKKKERKKEIKRSEKDEKDRGERKKERKNGEKSRIFSDVGRAEAEFSAALNITPR